MRLSWLDILWDAVTAVLITFSAAAAANSNCFVSENSQANNGMIHTGDNANAIFSWTFIWVAIDLTPHSSKAPMSWVGIKSQPGPTKHKLSGCTSVAISFGGLDEKMPLNIKQSCPVQFRFHFAWAIFYSFQCQCHIASGLIIHIKVETSTSCPTKHLLRWKPKHQRLCYMWLDVSASQLFPQHTVPMTNFQPRLSQTILSTAVHHKVS